MIRQYRAEDKERLVALLRQNTPQYFAPEEEEDFIYYLGLEYIRHYVYLEGEETVGCAGYSWEEETGRGMVSWFLVNTTQQGKGIGKSLLDHCLTELKEKTELQKIVVRTSQLVFRFFEKSGFVLVSTEKDYWAPGFDLYYMELPLK